ncbi:1,4-alpha-glucan branching enzyme GlgB [Porphyromonas cangingivalis]|uniref:alpha amylase C-terminal domain-containing protein n=1 Tax=Porphyromonas cangingivalis TaxID=36874 RepID=UPI000D813F64|nr:1,4-alpha-glucan branching enzyme GlgB [Porphyromonas cangingivalis]
MLEIIKQDPWLEAYEKCILSRHDYAVSRERELLGSTHKSLSDFASGHLYFGLHKTEGGWVFREWAPNATEIYFLCRANDWKPSEGFRLSRLKGGIWELCLDHDRISHGDHYKLLIRWSGGEGERIPAWSRYVVQDPHTYLFSAVVWSPNTSFSFKHERPILGDRPLLIYETHIGMSGEEEKVSSYREFKEHILPRIAAKGYNAIQIMAIMEHPYYGSFGYQVSSFFAPSSRFGTPDELKALIDEAHRLGLLVIMDLVHSHAVKNEVEGLAKFDGTHTQYFHDGERMMHPLWNSMCFDYGKSEVLHFLLSNCKYWLDEFNFDGFRFDGVTSMLYYSHGMGQAFVSYKDYYNGHQDGDAIMYLTLANKLIHEMRPSAITIAEEVSGMPGLALPFDRGGYGFDYRLAMNIPDFWIKTIKELPDEKWHPGAIWWELTNRRNDEKTISYVESHDQALVGDKTLVFRLMDKEMYWHMDKADTDATVERGISLHKMIRLACISTTNGGYLNFMGNEFGHPEWIDFPREGNGWSYKYARRQWSLQDNGFLKYEWLEAFDRAMVQHISSIKNIDTLPLQQLWSQDDEQVLAYSRGEYVYIFNFNPTKSWVDYKILAPTGEYQIILDSDDKQFGGQGRNDRSINHFTTPNALYTKEGKGFLSLYLPSRTALVLQRRKQSSGHNG